MKILQLHKLNEQQKTDIEDMVKVCLKAEGLERTLYLGNDMNFHENLDSFYLMYDNHRLVSVLVIFQPLEKEAEITAYTLPSERQKGYFDALFELAEAELAGFDVYRILFVVEPESVSGISAIKAYETNCVKSEYLLFYNMDKITDGERNTLIHLIELQKSKQDEAAYLSGEIFNTDLEEAFAVIESAMDSEFMKCYGAYMEDNLIGVCNVSYGANQASVFGFGIKPIYQGRGYGRILLNQVMDIIKKKGIKSVTLQVGSENTRAFSLYTSIGFFIQKQYDYYEYIIE